VGPEWSVVSPNPATGDAAISINVTKYPFRRNGA
jgi:hypothetical protein